VHSAFTVILEKFFQEVAFSGLGTPKYDPVRVAEYPGIFLYSFENDRCLTHMQEVRARNRALACIGHKPGKQPNTLFRSV
jgi:hypothetical protein